MIEAISSIKFLFALIFFSIMWFTLRTHFRRIDIPGDVFNMNSRMFSTFQWVGIGLLLLAFLFLTLTFYA